LEVRYRQSFLRDLKKLKRQPIYNDIFDFVFTTIPKIKTLREVSDIKIIKGYSNRFRIRMGDYRIGIEVHGDMIEIVRVLHRREFYRYFP
jgi:mRNA-degrading endonuclease RelE of RelBE toxin-antitoxin system